MMQFSGTGDTLINRPVAEHDFAQVAGDLEWRVGLDWTRPAPTPTTR